METMHNEQRTLMLPAPPNLDYRDAIVLRFERVWLALQMLTVRRTKGRTRGEGGSRCSELNSVQKRPGGFSMPPVLGAG